MTGTGTVKSAQNFALGEVAQLLQEAVATGDGQVWKQVITKDSLPVFNTYTVTYANYAGSNNKVTVKKIHGVDLLLKNEIFTNTGYKQTGWVTSDGKAYDLGDTYTTDADVTLYAVWTVAYTVTYDAGTNGTGFVATGMKLHDVSFTLSSNTFTRTGYTQTGWATTDGGEKNYELGGSYTENAAVTLYPVWKAIPAVAPKVSVSGTDVTYGQYTDKKISVTVIEQEGYPYSYQWYDGSKNKLTGETNSTYTIPNNLNADTHYYYRTVTAKRGDNNETATTDAKITFTITKATAVALPTPTAKNTITYGAALSTVGLPDGWIWADGNTVPTVTNNGYTAYYTSVDTDNYDWTAVDGWNASENRVERTVAVKVNKAGQTAPTNLLGTAETIDGKADGKITGVTSAMEYRNDSDTTYTTIYGTEITNLSDGKYYVRYKENDNYNASDDYEVVIGKGGKLTVTVPDAQVGYTLTADKTELAWNENVTLTFTLKDGYSKLDTFEVKVNGEPITLGDDGKYTVNNAQEDITITVAGVVDNTAPTGEIKISDNSWKSFLNSITFGFFFKDTQIVTITAEDKGSGVDKIYYYISENALSELEVDALEDDKWTLYDEKNKPSISPDKNKKCVVYVKNVDKVQNALYISSDGLVFDAIAPVISGITSGETYCEAPTVTVTEKYVDTVKVNGNTVTLDENGNFALSPAEGTQTVVVTDKAGNKTEMTVTVNDGHTGGTATCTDKAKCEVCGEPYGEVNAANHTAVKHIEAKKATTEAAGNIEYWHCTACDKYFADEACTIEITQADTVIAKLPVESEPATTDSDQSSETGDDFNMTLLMVLLIASCGGFAAATIYRRRHAK